MDNQSPPSTEEIQHPLPVEKHHSVWKIIIALFLVGTIIPLLLYYFLINTMPSPSTNSSPQTTQVPTASPSPSATQSAVQNPFTPTEAPSSQNPFDSSVSPTSSYQNPFGQ